MSLLTAASRTFTGSPTAPNDNGNGPPIGTPGTQEFKTSSLEGPNTTTAYDWTTRVSGGSSVLLASDELEDHRTITCTCAGAGQLAAIEQAISGSIGDVKTFSVEVVGTTTKTTPSAVFMNHIDFYDVSFEEGTSRPTLEQASNGTIFYYTIRFQISGSVKFRIGLDQPGVITLRYPMLDAYNALRVYSPSYYEEPEPPAVLSDIGAGFAYKTYGMMPRVMKYNNYSVVLARRAPMTGTITKLGFEVASNNPDDINPDGTPISRTKSMGTGNYTLSLELTRGKAPVSGDGLSGRFLPLAGGVSLSDVMFRPDFSQSLRTGSITHDRGNNLGSGDRRRWHIWTLPTPLDVTEGDQLCLIGYSKSSGADSDYVSFTNAPTTGPSSSFRLTGPWNLTPARTFSPREGVECFGMILAETGSYTATKANKRYNRNPEYGQLAFYYDDGTADGIPLRENNGLTTQFQIGGNYRLRERFRHLGETFDCRYIWLPCYWDDDGSQPGANLAIALTDETDANTWNASAAPDPEPGGDIVTQVRPFNGDFHTTTSYPDFTRFDLGANRTITSGHDFKIELSATSGTYWGYGGRHSVTAYDVTDSPPPPTTGLPALVGQNNPNVLSYAERSTNGGSSWSKFSLYGSLRTDVSLSYWLQPLTLAAALFLNPFSSASAAHRPMGSTATFSTTPPFTGYTDGTIADDNVFSNQSVYDTSSPYVEFTHSGALSGVGMPFTVRFPVSGFPTYVTNQTYDCAVTVVNEDGVGHDIYKINTIGGVRQAAIHRSYPLSGLGHGTSIGFNNRVGASGAGTPVFFGLVRKHEFETPGIVIGHAHQIALPWEGTWKFINRQLQLPAVCHDGFGATNDVSAPCKMGEHLAIKASELATVLTAIDGMAVSSAAKEMLGRYATAFAHYGIYVVDSAGQISFRADAVLDSTLKAAFVSFIRTILWEYLYIVTNSVTGATGVISSGSVLSGSAGTLTYPAGGGTAIVANTALV